MCKKAFDQEGQPTPCGPCPWAPPELLPDAELAFLVYGEVRGCRTGDGSFLDYGALFRFMDLEGISPGEQRETFKLIRAVEADVDRRQAEKLKKLQQSQDTHAHPHSKHRR